eukprot:IDg20738t1
MDLRVQRKGTHQSSEEFSLDKIEKLGKRIGNLLLSAYMLEDEIFSSNAVTYKIVQDVDMFVALIYGGFLSSVYCGRVVNTDGDGF